MTLKFQEMFLLNSGFNFAFDLALSHIIFFPAVCYFQQENVCWIYQLVCPSFHPLNYFYGRL